MAMDDGPNEARQWKGCPAIKGSCFLYIITMVDHVDVVLLQLLAGQVIHHSD